MQWGPVWYGHWNGHLATGVVRQVKLSVLTGWVLSDHKDILCTSWVSNNITHNLYWMTTDWGSTNRILTHHTWQHYQMLFNIYTCLWDWHTDRHHIHKLVVRQTYRWEMADKALQVTVVAIVVGSQETTCLYLSSLHRKQVNIHNNNNEYHSPLPSSAVLHSIVQSPRSVC